MVGLNFDIVGNDKSALRALDRVGDRSEKTGKRISNSFAKLGAGLAGAVVGAKVVDFLRDSVNASSDLNESISKSRAVFKASSKEVEAFASTASTKLGQSKQAALEAAGTFGNLFRALGIGEKPAASLSTKLVTLAGDLASFNNVSSDEALLALRSGLLGEAEPLRKFGVSLSAARIEAEALADGIVRPVKDAAKVKSALLAVESATKNVAAQTKKHGTASLETRKAQDALARSQEALNKVTKGSVPELTAAQKAQAAYRIVMKDTAIAQGDFSRTSDGLANQQRILSAQFTDVKAKLGDQLLPVVVDLAHFANNTLVPAISDFVDGMESGKGAGGQFADAVGEVGDGLETAWKVGKPFLGFIADHPKLFTEIAVGAGALATAMKVMGSVKKLPGIGSLVSKATPLPVFVVNNGVGGVPGLPGTGKGGSKLPPVVGKVPLLNPAGLGGAVALTGVTLVDKEHDSRDVLKQIKEPLVRLVAAQVLDAALKGLITKSGANDILKATQKGDLVKAYDFLKKYGAKTDEVKQQIAALAKDPTVLAALRERAQQHARNVELLTGGLLKVENQANTTSKNIGIKLGDGIGTGVRFAMDKADGLDTKLTVLSNKQVKPKVTLTGALAANHDAVGLLNNLRALDKLSVNPTVGITIRTNNDLPLPVGVRVTTSTTSTTKSAGGNHLSAFQPSWVGERGRERFVPDVPGTVLTHQESMRAAGGGGTSVTIEQINVLDNRTALSVPDQLRNSLWAKGIG